MIEVAKQGGIYIVKHITKELNEFALLYAMHASFNPEAALTAMTTLNNSQIQIHEFAWQAEP